MTGSAGIFDKAVGDTIYAADFNFIQSSVNLLLGTGLGDSGYGQTPLSGQVNSTRQVSVADWTDLRSDLAHVRQHQTGVQIGSASTIDGNNLVVVTTSTQVSADIINQYKKCVDVCATNRLVIADNQGSLTTNFNTSTKTNVAWNGKLTHSVTITFPTSDAARNFFNAGGQFRFSGSRSGGSVSDKNTSWTDLLRNMQAISFGAYGTSYTGSGSASTYPKSDLGWYTISTTDATVFVENAPSGNYSDNQYRIKASKNTNNNTATQLYFTIEFDDLNSGNPPILPLPKGATPGGVDENVDGILTSTISIFRPVGSNVELPAPSVVTTTNL